MFKGAAETAAQSFAVIDPLDIFASKLTYLAGRRWLEQLLAPTLSDTNCNICNSQFSALL